MTHDDDCSFSKIKFSEHEIGVKMVIMIDVSSMLLLTVIYMAAGESSTPYRYFVWPANLISQ